MTINKKTDGNELLVELAGRLDTSTAPSLEAEIKPELDNITSLVFDFEELEYISSAGLRALLLFQKTMNKQGSMVIHHVNDTIMEVFEITGFSDILTIE